MRGGWLYIMINKPRRVLFTGVTAHLAARVQQHLTGRGSAFCRRDGLDRLVCAQRVDTIEEAIVQESG